MSKIAFFWTEIREAPAVRFYLEKKETPKVKKTVNLYKWKKKQKGATTR